MPTKIKIFPSILVANKAEFVHAWKKLSPHFKYMQIDVMDGELTKYKNAIYPITVKDYIRGHNIEVHLMVEGVSKYAANWSKLKNVKKIIWHYEANTDTERILAINKFLKSKKIKTGLAINANTPLYKIKHLIKEFDTIQTMGIQAGAQGKRFQPKVLEKIKALRKKYPKLNIEVDGGVNAKTYPAIKKAGANIVCPGSYFQKADDIKKALKKLPN